MRALAVAFAVACLILRVALRLPNEARKRRSCLLSLRLFRFRGAAVHAKKKAFRLLTPTDCERLGWAKFYTGHREANAPTTRTSQQQPSITINSSSQIACLSLKLAVREPLHMYVSRVQKCRCVSTRTAGTRQHKHAQREGERRTNGRTTDADPGVS